MPAAPYKRSWQSAMRSRHCDRGRLRSGASGRTNRSAQAPCNVGLTYIKAPTHRRRSFSMGHTQPLPGFVARTRPRHLLAKLGWGRASFAPCGVSAMMQNIVAGLVVVALIFMVLIAWSQKHEKCFHGHILGKLKPCGLVEHEL